MNKLRRYLGLVWLLLAALCGYVGIVYFGWPKLTSGQPDDLVFGVIILFVLLPIIVSGLACFGLFAWQGDYDE